MIRAIEELSMNAFPAMDTMYYDGWMIRMSEGKSKRVNSVYSLYPSAIPIEEKVLCCENVFRENRLRRIFKLTEQETCSGLDSFLRGRRYKEAGRTQIKTLSLKNREFGTDCDFEYFTDFPKDWYRDLCHAENRKPIDKLLMAEAWKRVVPPQCYISCLINGRRIAFGRGVLDKGFIGIYGVFVDEQYRGRGYGRKITEELLAYGKKKGCDSAYLQVEDGNHKAIRLYEKIGFSEAYQYWYLLKEIGE